MADKVVKYSAVKRAILELVEDNGLKVHDQIPSERELIDRFNVSRITVRKAVDDLVNVGSLYRVQGKGTYVQNNEQPHDLFSLTSCTEEIERLGMVASRRVIHAEVMTAEAALATRLDIKVGERVFLLERVYYANGQPVNYTQSHMPLDLFPGIEDHDFGRESLYVVMENQYGVKITNAKRMIEADLARESVASYLEVEQGAPLILFHSSTNGEVGVDGASTSRVAETFRCWYRTDVHKFFINQVR